MKYKKIEINGDDWNAVHDLEEHIPFSFTCGKQDQPDNPEISILELKIGELSESMSLPQKAIIHEFMNIEGYNIETKAVIPFGSEPVISREFEYLPNIVKITTDVQIRRGTVADNFEVDSLKLTGNWKKYALINLSEGQKNLGKITWKKLPSSSIFKANTHFHIFLLESEDGTRIEIGAGFDLWRWNGNSGSEIQDQKSPLPEGMFSIEQTDEGIIIQRHIMAADKNFEISSHNWRFNWYLAWSSKNDQAQKDCPCKEKVLNYQPSQCFHAKPTKNQLKKAVRSVINTLNKEILCLHDVEPQICTNSSHISRPGKKGLQHWDMTDIIELWFWTNRQVMKKDSNFILTPPKESIFMELPSFQRMSIPLRS